MTTPDPNVWNVEYDGYGTVDQTTAGSITMQPQYVVAPNTSACLVTSVGGTSGDVTVKARMRTVQQRPSPNPWEVAWLWWNYHRETNPNAEQGTGTNDGYARFAYYVTLKTNGWEIGKLDQTNFTGTMGGQRYLADDVTPTFPIGVWHDVQVDQVGATITVTVDGVKLATVTDTGGTVPGETIYTSGGVGLYCEDSAVEFTNVSMSGTTLLPPTERSSTMAGSRFTLVPSEYWKNTSKAIQGLNTDLKAAEDTLAAGGGGGGGVTSYNQLTDKPNLATVATTGQYADLLTKPDLSVYAPKANPTFTGTVSGITKAMVGLGNVDNTADTAKVFNASQITGGVFPPARLGTGTPSASMVLWGDGAWKAAPASGGTATTDASQLTSGILPNARLSTAVPLISRDPATRPTTDPNVMVQFWCTTQPTAMLTNDVWMQTA